MDGDGDFSHHTRKLQEGERVRHEIANELAQACQEHACFMLNVEERIQEMQDSIRSASLDIADAETAASATDNSAARQDAIWAEAKHAAENDGCSSESEYDGGNDCENADDPGNNVLHDDNAACCTMHAICADCDNAGTTESEDDDGDVDE